MGEAERVRKEAEIENPDGECTKVKSKYLKADDLSLRRPLDAPNRQQQDDDHWTFASGLHGY